MVKTKFKIIIKVELDQETRECNYKVINNSGVLNSYEMIKLFEIISIETVEQINKREQYCKEHGIIVPEGLQA